MPTILLTGATGNVGQAVLKHLLAANQPAELIAAVRKIHEPKAPFPATAALPLRRLDMEDPATFASALEGVDRLFLLRPPQISKVETYFRPLLEAAKAAHIKGLVFLSVQGAERSSVIPHNKIEKLIRSLDFSYIFVRPSYFMQNLTTTLLPEIQQHQRITLPAAQAKFNWVDVDDIGAACAQLLLSFEHYQNEAYEITGTENLNFQSVAGLLSEITGKNIQYQPISPLRFYFKKRKEGHPSGFALVMTLLHFLPRLQAEPAISHQYQQITGKAPTSLRDFLEREKRLFLAETR